MNKKPIKIQDGPAALWGRDVEWGDRKPPIVEQPFWTIEVGKSKRPRRNRNQPTRQGIQ